MCLACLMCIIFVFGGIVDLVGLVAKRVHVLEWIGRI